MPAKKKTEVKMTPEILAKLKGVSVVSDTIDYIHEIEDVPKEFHPTFVLKVFTVSEAKPFQEKYADGANEDDAMEDIRQRIVGWKDVRDRSTGELVEFESDSDGGISKDLFDTMDLSFRILILGQLYSLSLT
jgi:hypothetical protein